MVGAIGFGRRLVKAATRRVMAAARPSMVRAWHLPGKQRCPICRSRLRAFLAHGDPPRSNARCPVCGSLERHRLDWLFMQRRTDLFDGQPKSLLHVAPEKFFATRLSRIAGIDYLSVDLDPKRAMLQDDLTDLSSPDDCFSVIYCSHVLEHIPDDRRAMAEMVRVLKPGGWALINVPVTVPETFEDPAVTSPEERARVFGQHDHVRRCGPDYGQRMEAAGFRVEVLRATDLVDRSQCAYFSFQPGRLIFHCRKPSAGPV